MSQHNTCLSQNMVLAEELNPGGLPFPVAALSEYCQIPVKKNKAEFMQHESTLFDVVKLERD